MVTAVVETRLLVLNADPVFQDEALAILDSIDRIETPIEENFDAILIENGAAIAVEQAVNVRQHFPSLKVACLTPDRGAADSVAMAEQQDITLILRQQRRGFPRKLKNFVHSLERPAASPSEGIDPCHSLIGNLNQFSAAEILQMSCLSQRSGRFTFKSGRGNSEIYLQQGSVRHAVFGSLEGELAVAEIFRWRQGRFYFEEGIISQEQTVNRPWAHLLIDNLQKLDETLELVSV